MENIEYGLYNPDPEFLERAKKINPSVITDVVYVGPVAVAETKHGPTNLFAPITAYGKEDSAKQFVGERIYLGIKFNAMLPITSAKLLKKAEVDDDMKQFYMTYKVEIKALAQNEYDYR